MIVAKSRPTPNPTVNVIGNFVGGGSGQGNIDDRQNRYELQNYTSLIHGNHISKFGGRLRATQDTSLANSGFNGTFTFSSTGYARPTRHRIARRSAATLHARFPVLCRATIGGAGGTPYATQLTYTTGLPGAEVTYYDVGLYVQDDWRIKPNITLSSGLRFETQNAIHDHGDWAPRLGFAWGVGGRSAPPKVVIRGGYGIFYDRFQSAQMLQAERLNGVTQQQFIINNPTCFPDVDVALTGFSNCGAASPRSSNIYQIGPNSRALHAARARSAWSGRSQSRRRYRRLT